MYPRRVSELPRVKVNGYVAKKLPGETLMLDEVIHQPLYGTVARGIGSGAVIAGPRANYPIVLPFGSCCGMGDEPVASRKMFISLLGGMIVGGLAILWLTRKEKEKWQEV
jgi:hypothetical protein